MEEKFRGYVLFVLGVVLGVSGNFFASAVVEAINGFISPFSVNAKTTLWIAISLFFAVPLLWILKRLLEFSLEVKVLEVTKKRLSLINKTNFLIYLCAIAGIFMTLFFILQILSSA